MVGTIGQIPHRIGGYAIVNKTDTGLEISLLAGSKILCTNCTATNESTLIANGSIIKVSTGYDILKDMTITVQKDDTIPLTVLYGREILYVNGVTSGSNFIAYLPKGSRINKTLVENTGEFTVPASTQYLIEY